MFSQYEAANGSYEIWKDQEENVWSVNVLNYSLIRVFNATGFRLKREAVKYAKEVLEIKA